MPEQRCMVIDGKTVYWKLVRKKHGTFDIIKMCPGALKPEKQWLSLHMAHEIVNSCTTTAALSHAVRTLAGKHLGVVVQPKDLGCAKCKYNAEPPPEIPVADPPPPVRKPPTQPPQPLQVQVFDEHNAEPPEMPVADPPPPLTMPATQLLQPLSVQSDATPRTATNGRLHGSRSSAEITDAFTHRWKQWCMIRSRACQRPRRVAVVNPNTSTATTATMTDIARDAARALGISAALIEFAGVTAPFGPPLLVDRPALAIAAEAVASLAPQLISWADAVIVGAFGDPGRAELCASLGARGIPVVGLGQASMAEAAASPAGFAVAQTIPSLNASITELANSYGHGHAMVAVRSPSDTDGNPTALMSNEAATEAALAALVREAIEIDEVCTVIIGGGPLARAARALARRFDGCTIVEPIPAAVAAVARHLALMPDAQAGLV